MTSVARTDAPTMSASPTASSPTTTTTTTTSADALGDAFDVYAPSEWTPLQCRASYLLRAPCVLMAEAQTYNESLPQAHIRQYKIILGMDTESAPLLYQDAKYGEPRPRSGSVKSARDAGKSSASSTPKKWKIRQSDHT